MRGTCSTTRESQRTATRTQHKKIMLHDEEDVFPFSGWESWGRESRSAPWCSLLADVRKHPVRQRQSFFADGDTETHGKLSKSHLPSLYRIHDHQACFFAESRLRCNGVIPCLRRNIISAIIWLLQKMRSTARHWPLIAAARNHLLLIPVSSQKSPRSSRFQRQLKCGDALQTQQLIPITMWHWHATSFQRMSPNKPGTLRFTGLKRCGKKVLDTNSG